MKYRYRCPYCQAKPDSWTCRACGDSKFVAVDEEVRAVTGWGQAMAVMLLVERPGLPHYACDGRGCDDEWCVKGSIYLNGCKTIPGLPPEEERKRQRLYMGGAEKDFLRGL